MSAMANNENNETKAPDIACSSDSPKNPPTRRGIIVNLVVENADKFVDFMGKAAGCKEYFRFAGENGKVLHLALDIDGVATYVNELGNDMDTGEIATPHVRLNLNSDDPIGMAEKMVKAGAKELTKCKEQFWGALYGEYMDPFGLIWCVSNSTNPLQDVPEELARKVVPFVSIRDATSYLAFLSEAFGAQEMYPPSKDPTGKIMCAEMKLNGGLMMIGDYCGGDAHKTEPSVTVSYEVAPGEAAPLAKAFKANGGDIVDEPSMQFWGQVWGRCKDPSGQAWGLCETQAGPPLTEKDMAVDMEIGSKFDWKYMWKIEDVPTMHCFGEIRKCLAKAPSISEDMGQSLPASFAEATKVGASPIGPPLAIYYTWDSAENGKTSFTAGPMVAAGASAPDGDGFGVREAGGCKGVTVVHVGPYPDLMKTYTATFEWIEAKGYEIRMPLVEVFENSPKEVAEAELRTKIYIPIVPKGSPSA